MVDPASIVTGPAGDGEHPVVTDRRGRKLRLRRIGPLLRTKLFKLMGPTNSNNLQLFGHYQIAVSVVAIDDEQIPFPPTETFLEALIDRLGEDGFQAAAQGWRDNGWLDADAGNPDNVKN